MGNENYMTPAVLRGLAECCEALDPLWNVLTGSPRGGVSVEAVELNLNVFDSNGEQLGRIDWADGGAAFYPQQLEK